MAILDPQLWPERGWSSLSDRLGRLDPERLRAVVDQVARAVVRAVADETSFRNELLDPGTTDARLREIEESLDQRAWDAQEALDEAEYLRWFRRARATSAVIATRREPASEAAGRTFYEARHALDDDQALQEILVDALD